MTFTYVNINRSKKITTKLTLSVCRITVDCWSKGGDAVNSEFVVTGERSVSSELEEFPVVRLFVWKGSCDVEDAEVDL